MIKGVCNRTIFEGDNLEVMKRVNSNSVDLIYLDPPFNTNRTFASGFDDTWSDTANIKGWSDDWHIEDNAWLHSYLTTIQTYHSASMYHYLLYMAVRLIEMSRIMTLNGSIYLHCDTSAGHYIKPMLDIIFGCDNFRNEIVWNSAIGAKNDAVTRFGRAHDTIFFYARPSATFNVQYAPLTQDYIDAWYRHSDPDGRRYMASPLTRRPAHEYEFLGKTRRWECKREQMDVYLAQGRIIHKTTTPGSKAEVARYKSYLDESQGRPAQDNWTDIKALAGYANENTGYPTQKPLALLDRIIRASSNEGDVVLDPFCGSATTLVAAERLGRRWVGIDIEVEAVKHLRERLVNVLGLNGVHTHRTDLPS